MRLLRHRKDHVFESTCTLSSTRRSAAAPFTSRGPRSAATIPDSQRCGYYEFLKFERAHQDDKEFIALT